ncbi:hypothetical protein KSZ_06950 [Dictyobacter formicarum]|uniref:ISAs1 family transposase n=2 Tax=Dictyobacter formicarum TaxID=2778368 RepID=A0ABQ3VA86_9CHLR|nr:hypothetical protein KSZ_06950 [Dictyobacter formicarum]
MYAAMQQLTDGRRKQGTRYPLALVLSYVLLAKAAGATSLQAISEWIRLRAHWLQEMLPGVGESFPCAATSSKVLRAVDAEQVNAVLMSLLTRVQAAEREAGQQQHIAVDGKTLRGTQHHVAEDQKKVHQITMYEVHTGVILKEQVVQEKEGEQRRIGELLQPQWVKGRIVSADALHTHASVCSRIVASAGDYVLFAKGNQPTLQEDLQLFFSEPSTDCRDWREGETLDKGHGRKEVRTLVASTELNDFLGESGQGWPRSFASDAESPKRCIARRSGCMG